MKSGFRRGPFPIANAAALNVAEQDDDRTARPGREERARAPAPGPDVAGGALRHVLLVMPTFFPEVYGGAERQGFILAKALHRKGVRTTIIAPALAPAQRETEHEFGRVIRLRVRHYPNLGGTRIASTISWALRVGRWAYAHRHDIDVVYVFHARLHALAAAVAAALARKPLFIKFGLGGEGFDFTMLRAKRFGYGGVVADILQRQAAGFVANSALIAADLAALGVEPHRILAFPNGVELPPREQVERSLPDRAENRFIFTGRLADEKNVDQVLEAAALCRDRGAAIALTFLGDGPSRGPLAERAVALRLGDQVRLPGRQDDTYPELFAHRFYVSGSDREGQSNSLLEAMSAGCIPIVVGASGVAEAVSHGKTGFIAAAPTAAALAEAMMAACALSTTERARLSLAAYDFASDNLGIDRIAERTIEAFTTVLRQRAQPRMHRP